MSKNKFVKPNQDYMPEGDSTLLQKDIEELGLSEYTLNKLKEVDIVKIIDLARCQMKHFYRIPGISKKNVFEILKKMQNVGLDFKRSAVAATTMDNEEEAKPIPKTKIQEKPKNQSVEKNNEKDNKNGKNKKENKKEKIANKPINAEPNIVNQNQNRQNDKNQKFDSKAKQGKKSPIVTSEKKALQNNDIDKKSNNAFEDKRGEEPRRNNPPQKPQKSEEPKRVKVNSYELDAFMNDNYQNKSNLKQEREDKIAKAIKNLPPIKNEDGLYKFYRHGKWGYKTESGKVVIEPTYSEAFNFREGLACVELNERCGFINKQGEVVIPIQYDTACSFSEGLASVTKADKCGYIDKEGNIVFDFIYDAATSFQNDIALVKKDGKWGYMDRKTGDIRLR